MTLQGKTLHELQTLERTQVSDSDLLLVGDISDPLISKAMSVNGLRVIMGAVYQTSESINQAIDSPSWIVEGAKGFWKVSVLSAVEDALGYYLWYYNDDLENWVLWPKVITETRATLGMTGGALVLEVNAVRDDDGIAVRTYRRFKIQTFTETEQSPLSSEQSAYTITSLPASFTPATPTLVDDETYPYTEALPSYNGYSHSIVLLVTAATGEGDYIERYELQRRPYVLDQGDKVGWLTLPPHPLGLDPALPSPTKLIYQDDSAKAAAGDVFDYRVRAVDTNGTPSDWTDPADVVSYTVLEDDTAPDAPVFTVKSVGLGFLIVIDDPTQNGGDPCDDIWYWKVFYNKDGEGWTSVADVDDDGKDRRFTEQRIVFQVPDADLDSSYLFRVMAFDWSKLESDYSAETSPLSPTKLSEDVMDLTWENHIQDIEDGVSANYTDIIQNADDIILRATTTYVDGEVSGLQSQITVNADGIDLRATKAYVDGSTILGAITVNAGEIDLRVEYGEDISSFVLNESGLRLSGASVVINGSTTFTDDVEIQGLLKSSGGLKTATSGQRIEIGAFGGSAKINFYSTGANVGFIYESGGYLRYGNMQGSYFSYWDANVFNMLVSSDVRTSLIPGSIAVGSSGTFAELTKTALKLNGITVLTGRVADPTAASYAAANPPTKIEFDALVDIVNAYRTNMKAVSVMA